MAENRYTFGDDARASDRLRRLAELYDPELRALLGRAAASAPGLALDLGCGPGWSTRVIADVLRPSRTVGLDSSERYVAEARACRGEDLEFLVHDVTHLPFPVEAPDLLLCRFLLTHLREPQGVLAAWAKSSARGALLLVHETEGLEARHPALMRYYELLAEMQRHHGQALQIGAALETLFASTPWTIVDSRALPLDKPAARMADLHLANLRSWRDDSYARATFDRTELDRLELALQRIATGDDDAGTVRNTARQIVARA